MLTFRPFPPPAGKITEPERLVALTKDMAVTRQPLWPHRQDARTTIRSRQQVEQALETGAVSTLRLVEWILALSIQRAWEARDRTRAEKAARLMWQEARTQPYLARMLVRKLVLDAFEQSPKHETLWRTYARAEIHTFSEDWVRRYKLIACLKRPKEAIPRALAEYALEQNMLVAIVVQDHLGMPGSNLEAPTLQETPKVFIHSSRVSHAEAWLIKNLNDMTPDQQNEAILYLLRSLTDDAPNRFGRLVMWIKSKYQQISGTSGSIPHNLVSRLRDWIGAVNYGDFEKLVNTLASSGLVPDNNIKQLIRRSAFWSNYRDRFSNIRILLPSTSMRYFETSEITTDDVIMLELDDTPSGSMTEICIFDFESTIVVEFFRGPSSETLMFEGSDDIREALFKPNIISICRLRFLAITRNALWLDHFYLWQRLHERELYKRGISPKLTDGKFRWDPVERPWPYKANTGPGYEPDAEGLEKRMSNLKHWHVKVETSKATAIRWAQRNGLAISGHPHYFN